jgi:hypothetical protein
MVFGNLFPKPLSAKIVHYGEDIKLYHIFFTHQITHLKIMRAAIMSMNSNNPLRCPLLK